ncbi:MAG: 7-cyano-7-deazaguanine synthase [Sphaerochaeta sp.]
MEKKLYVVSHSGGLDSTTMLAKALKEGNIVLPLNFNYGQKNVIEISAQQQSHNYFKNIYGDQLLDTINIDLTTSIGDPIKKFQINRDNGLSEEKHGMKYYMPSRNLLFLSLCAVVGEIIATEENYDHIIIGIGIHKHSDVYERDYWDISPEFADRLNFLISLNDVIKITVDAPYKDKYKEDIIKDMMDLAVPYDLTWTCYDPQEVKEGRYRPCHACEACLERQINAKSSSYEDIINSYELTI